MIMLLSTSSTRALTFIFSLVISPLSVSSFQSSRTSSACLRLLSMIPNISGSSGFCLRMWAAMLMFLIGPRRSCRAMLETLLNPSISLLFCSALSLFTSSRLAIRSIAVATWLASISSCYLSISVNESLSVLSMFRTPKASPSTITGDVSSALDNAYS